MATLQRLSRLPNLVLKHSLRCRCQNSFARHLSSVDKSKQLSDPQNANVINQSEELERLTKHFADTDPNSLRNWSPAGWTYTDRELDNWHHAVSMFSAFTLVICLGFFIYFYVPDYQLRDWAQREAFLDLDRRERRGLPAIDPYFVPPEKVILPSEAEIGDKEIIV